LFLRLYANEVVKEPTIGFSDEIAVESPFSPTRLVAAAENYRLSLGIEGEPPHAILRIKPQFLHVGSANRSALREPGRSGVAVRAFRKATRAKEWEDGTAEV
jgi:hypothetical protein